jgi:hypothetical protein
MESERSFWKGIAKDMGVSEAACKSAAKRIRLRARY